MPKGSAWPKAGRPPVSVRVGEPLWPVKDEDHRQFSRRMMQAVSQLIDEDRTSWWEAIRRADSGETPMPGGPAGPKWLRVWEGTKHLPHRGPARAWKR